MRKLKWGKCKVDEEVEVEEMIKKMRWERM